MSDVTIICNNVPRDILEAYELTVDERSDFDYELTVDERSDFDYLDWDKLEAGEDSASFFRYKGDVYDLGDISAVDHRPDMDRFFRDWDGILTDSFFSGILVRYCDYFERVVVARYYC